MKRMFYISLSLNIVIILFFVGKRLYWSYGLPAHKGIANYETINQGKYSAYDGVAIDSNDIVFIGNSLTEGFPLDEYFHRTDIKNRGIGGSETSHLLDRI